MATLPFVGGKSSQLLVEVGNLGHGLLDFTGVGLYSVATVPSACETVDIVVMALRQTRSRAPQSWHLLKGRVRRPDLIKLAVNLVDAQLELKEREAVDRLCGDVHDHGQHMDSHAGNEAEFIQDPEGWVATPDGEV